MKFIHLLTRAFCFQNKCVTGLTGIELKKEDRVRKTFNSLLRESQHPRWLFLIQLYLFDSHIYSNRQHQLWNFQEECNTSANYMFIQPSEHIWLAPLNLSWKNNRRLYHILARGSNNIRARGSITLSWRVFLCGRESKSEESQSECP